MVFNKIKIISIIVEKKASGSKSVGHIAYNVIAVITSENEPNFNF